MAQASKLTKSTLEHLGAAQRLRGLFADIAPARILVDELIADRRAEAEAEDREGNTRIAMDEVIALLSEDPPPAPPAFHAVRDGLIVRWIDTPG